MNGNYFQRLENAAKLCKLRVIRCGHEGADCQLADSAVNIGGKHILLKLGVTGKHWTFNSLFALAAISALGLSVEKSAAKLAEFEEPEGRGRVIKIMAEGKPVWLIDDSYNASPASMNAAFDKTQDVWKEKGGTGRKIAALGNMLELGLQTVPLHQNLEVGLNSNHFDRVFTAGNHMKHLHEAMQPPMRAGHAGGAMQLLPLLSKELRAGDILLIKGSHGSKMYELAKALQAMPKGNKNMLYTFPSPLWERVANAGTGERGYLQKIFICKDTPSSTSPTRGEGEVWGKTCYIIFSYPSRNNSSCSTCSAI